MALVLELNYKQGDKYYIKYNNKSLAVTKEKLIDIIKNTSAPQRNCRINNIKSDTIISMKSGYGKLINKSKDYVEIVDCLDDSYIDAVKDYRERDFNEYTCCSKFKDILELEQIKVYKDDILKTRYGIIDANKLSSGMKSLLVLNWYITHNKSITIDLSSCGGKHLGFAFNMIAKSGLDIKVIIRHICLNYIETNIKYNNTIMNSDEYLEYVLDRWE